MMGKVVMRTMTTTAAIMANGYIVFAICRALLLVIYTLQFILHSQLLYEVGLL